jgi:hypothetical protein
VDGSRRRADLRREVRQCGQVVPEDCGGVGETIAGQLHPVTRVTGEPDDDAFFLFDRLGHHWCRA